MTDQTFEVGKFYYVLLVLDPDCEQAWERGYVPARFAGYDERGAETWNFLDAEPSAWPVRWAEACDALNDLNTASDSRPRFPILEPARRRALRLLNMDTPQAIETARLLLSRSNPFPIPGEPR